MCAREPMRFRNVNNVIQICISISVSVYVIIRKMPIVPSTMWVWKINSFLSKLENNYYFNDFRFRHPGQPQHLPGGQHQLGDHPPIGQQGQPTGQPSGQQGLQRRNHQAKVYQLYRVHSKVEFSYLIVSIATCSIFVFAAVEHNREYVPIVTNLTCIFLNVDNPDRHDAIRLYIHQLAQTTPSLPMEVSGSSIRVQPKNWSLKIIKV